MHTARWLFALTVAAVAVPAGAAEWATPEAKARWAEVSGLVFGPDAAFETTDRLVTVEAPGTARDAALVPVTLNVASDAHLKELNLVIDQNPAPLAAKVRFGPAGDSRQMKLRVRVDGFTNMRAVAATEDGKLLQNAVFVKGAGGCSAPMGMSVAEASANMGEMRMKFSTNGALDAPQATLMVRHPNFNGMQKDPATNTYTPSRFINAITVKRGDESVFAMTSDISLSTNPVVEFLYAAGDTRPFTVTVLDTSGASWTQSFDPPQTMN